MQGGLIFVTRYAVDGSDPVSQGSARRDPGLRMTPGDAMNQYRGFDGLIWRDVPAGIKVENGFADFEALDTIKRHAAERRARGGRHDVLHVTVVDAESDQDAPLPPFFDLVGYDLGFYEGEFNHYSVVYHEVIFGLIPEMRDLAVKLGSSLLLPTLDDARYVLSTRKKVVASGADLEEGEPHVLRVAVLRADA